MAMTLDEFEALLDSGAAHLEEEYAYTKDQNLPHARQVILKLFAFVKAMEYASCVPAVLVNAYDEMMAMLGRPDPADELAAEAFALSG